MLCFLNSFTFVTRKYSFVKGTTIKTCNSFLNGFFIVKLLCENNIIGFHHFYSYESELNFKKRISWKQLLEFMSG